MDFFRIARGGIALIRLATCCKACIKSISVFRYRKKSKGSGTIPVDVYFGFAVLRFGIPEYCNDEVGCAKDRDSCFQGGFTRWWLSVILLV